MDTEHNAITEPVRRIEVFTGTGRRRSWSAEDKTRIVAETLIDGETVCAVARRHGLSPQQLFGWRRQARQAAASTQTEKTRFVPAVVESALPERTARRRQRKQARQVNRISGSIEVETAGVTVRIGRGVDTKTVAAVLRALKAAPRLVPRARFGCWWRRSRWTSAKAPRVWQRWCARLWRPTRSRAHHQAR